MTDGGSITEENPLSVLRALASLVLPQGPVSTSRLSNAAGSSAPLFALETSVDAASAFFCRAVLVDHKWAAFLDGHHDDHHPNGRNKSTADGEDENDEDTVLGRWSKSSSFGKRTERLFRISSATLLAVLAYRRVNYTTICAVHLYTHVVPLATMVLLRWTRKAAAAKKGTTKAAKKKPTPTTSMVDVLSFLLVVLAAAPACMYLCRLLSNPAFLLATCQLIPKVILDGVEYMFPVQEMIASYGIVSSFVDVEGGGERLRRMLRHLLFVTFHAQVGLGYLGIDFLKAEQTRRNMLIRMDLEKPPDHENDTTSNGENDKDDEGNIGEGKKSRSKSKSNGAAASKKKKSSTKKFDASRKFRLSAAPFILFTAVPYMFKIIFFGNLNNFALMYVRNEIHRSVRIDELFGHDSHLTAVAADSTSSPDVYATAMDTVVSTSYDFFNRKLFSLPKLVLLPGIISRQPGLLVKIFPFIIITDVIKGRIVASVTDKIEELDRDARDINAVRQKVEQFDLKNAELLRRSGVGGGSGTSSVGGATAFTRRRWDELTQSYQDKDAASKLLKRTRGFYSWLQRNFVFMALIDCALAKLLAEGMLVASDIFVFSRAIEDAVDVLLMRSRSESELATLMAQIEKLGVLEGMWSKSKEENLLPCRAAVDSMTMTNDVTDASYGSIKFQNLQYTRGTASISIERLDVEPGIYAVTGANGSGKSTLFRLLMACETNERPIDLHPSIALGCPTHEWENELVKDGVCEAEDCPSEENTEATSIVMPSQDVVEISQTFYWPLYSKPVDWIYQKHITSDCDDDERKQLVRRAAEELMSLSFSQAREGNNINITDVTQNGGVEGDINEEAVAKLELELQEEKEDWFGELSGGQKSKVELVRKVFLRDECPSVLLVDETMAPLDPASKSQVMNKIKNFCNQSVVLVIYHTDVGASVGATAADGGVVEECVPGNDFFDHNLHVDNGRLVHRPVC